MLALRNILVPVDFSPPCARATEYARQLANQFQAQLHLLHVIEDPVVYLPMYESYPVPSRAQFEEFAQTRLGGWIATPLLLGVKLHTAFRHGAPALEIASYADEIRADLLVMGTHGRGLASRWFLGSVAERVVRTARVPVLSVHSGDRPWQDAESSTNEPVVGSVTLSQMAAPASHNAPRELVIEGPTKQVAETT
ncbi:MAG: universal stress protein [Planctomycetaceae bacterium]